MDRESTCNLTGIIALSMTLLCMISVIVKRSLLPPCVADGRSRNLFIVIIIIIYTQPTVEQLHGAAGYHQWSQPRFRRWRCQCLRLQSVNLQNSANSALQRPPYNLATYLDNDDNNDDTTTTTTTTTTTAAVFICLLLLPIMLLPQTLFPCSCPCRCIELCEAKIFCELLPGSATTVAICCHLNKQWPLPPM